MGPICLTLVGDMFVHGGQKGNKELAQERYILVHIFPRVGQGYGFVF